jgi:hypothetical protein
VEFLCVLGGGKLARLGVFDLQVLLECLWCLVLIHECLVVVIKPLKQVKLHCPCVLLEFCFLLDVEKDTGGLDCVSTRRRTRARCRRDTEQAEGVNELF